MRTGKIGLNRFFYERNVQSVEGTDSACGEGEDTVRQILTECSQFGEMRTPLGHMRS